MTNQERIEELESLIKGYNREIAVLEDAKEYAYERIDKLKENQ